MKRILITGANSYIGTSLEKWLSQWLDKYTVHTIDMIDGTWRQASFVNYDVVFHVAGIAHVSSKSEMKDLYYRVNRDLAIETARKSKDEGVKQFIFMSSIIVYGNSADEQGIIYRDTVPKPSNFYGYSKLQAEEGIRPLEDEDFKVVILRPPMIYGKGSKGNYPRLAKLALKTPIFPDIDNNRSMLHIDNFCEFTRLMIDNEESGLFFPQNREYVKTSEMVRLIAEVHGKKIRLVKFFNPVLRLMIGRVNIVNKVFGNFLYERSLSDYEKANYQSKSFRQSIERMDA